MHHTRPRLGQSGFFASGQVDGMAVNRPLAQQALRFVGVKVIARLREQVFDPSNLVCLFGQVRLH